MAKTNDRKHEKIERRAKSNRIWRRFLFGVSLAAFLSSSLIDYSGFGQTFTTAADTKVTKKISSNTTLEAVESNVLSFVFEGPYALTLVNGQTLDVAFISKQKVGETKKASVVFGQSSSTTKQVWTITNSNPSWLGVFKVLDGDTLEVKSTGANPLGKYTEASDGDFSIVSLSSGSTLKLSAVLKSDGTSIENETKMGALLTGFNESKDSTATVEVETNQTLTVEDGLVANGTLVKKGAGTLQVLVNKYSNWEQYVKNALGVSSESETTVKTADESEKVDSLSVTETGSTPLSIGALKVESGTFRIAGGTTNQKDDGTSEWSVSEVGAQTFSEDKLDSISLGADATLDIVYAGEIGLTGAENATVFSADDGAVVKLYVDQDGYTSYVSDASASNMQIGSITLDVNAQTQKEVASEMTVFATYDSGIISYQKDNIKVVDNLLGRYYVVDDELSTESKIVLKQQEDTKFKTYGTTPNERSAGASIDSIIKGGNYSLDQRVVLERLDEERSAIDFGTMTGELHASTVGFMYMNNLNTTQTLMEHMRNKQLVAYSGDSSVAPMDYGDGAGASSQQNNAAYYGGASGGNFDQGPLYYNTDTNSYAPGVVPIYNNSGAGSYQMGYPSGGGYTGGVYNGETYSEGGYEYGTSGSVPVSGSYNLGWSGALQRSTLSTLRGQEAEYGDPGTLIYSAWATSLGASSEAKVHKDAYAYKGTQAGLLGGLDLFGSCDCRFGAFYGYQKNELKDKDEKLVKGLSLGGLKTQDHLLGLYHQYGDETVYNIAMIRVGYDQYKTERNSVVLDSAATFKSKYNGYNAGVSYERGANFAAEPFVFSPYASLDYNFLYREKIKEESASDSYVYANNFGLIAKKSMYHSLRGQLGGRIALDLYPASMQLRFVVRAAYLHEFLNAMHGKTQMCYSTFQDCNSYFNVYGNSMGRDWGITGLGIDWAPIPCLVIAAKSDCLWNKYVTDAYGSLGLKFRW